MGPGEESRPTGIEQRGKLDEDDHDLLTFGEAAARLRIEIETARSAVRDLEERGDTANIAAARDRLAALLAAAARNSSQPITDANFERFFGYRGKARTNLPGHSARE